MLRMIFSVLLIVSVLMFSYGIVLAQEATPEPTPEVVVPGEFDYENDTVVVLDILQILGIVVSSFLIGGVTIGVLALRILKDKTALDTLERITVNTVPAHLLLGARTVIKNGKRFVVLADMITDGQPNEPLTDEELEQLGLR